MSASRPRRRSLRSSLGIITQNNTDNSDQDVDSANNSTVAPVTPKAASSQEVLAAPLPDTPKGMKTPKRKSG